MTTNPRSREAAYADIVGGLIDARVDVASERFDAEVAAAEASGRLDPATARLLRWWQRESVRAVSEHARTTIPASLVVLERAASDARDAAHRADAAWTTARGVTARASRSSDPSSSRSSLAGTVDAWARRAAAPASAPVDPAPAPAPTQPQAPSAEPAAAAPAAPPAPPEPHLPPTLEPPGYPEARSADPASSPPAAPPLPQTPQAPIDLTDTGERRRTLVAGLTVLPQND